MAGTSGSRLAKAMARAHKRCFLCRNAILTEQQGDALERLLADAVPSRLEFAHRECAEKEGLWEGSDADVERPRSR